MKEVKVYVTRPGNAGNADKVQQYLTEIANNLELDTIRILAEKSRKKGIDAQVKKFSYLV